jgi:hypothetical protein
MVKRTTVSIRDELYEEMKKWQKHFNYSKIFENAVEKAINFRKELLENLEDQEMIEAIERLKEEKIEAGGGYRQMGYDDGILWAKEAHYEELLAFLEWEPNRDYVPSDETLYGLRDYIENAMFDEDDNLSFSDLKLGARNEFNDAWIAGLVEGINDFWDEVKDKL